MFRFCEVLLRACCGEVECRAECGVRVCYKHVDTLRPPRPMTTAWTDVRAAQRAPRDGRAHRAGPTYAPNEYFLSVENKI